MKIFIFMLLLTTSWFAAAAPSDLQAKNYDIAGRCFWVYRSVNEIGKSPVVGSSAIQAYGMRRITWMSGYFKAQEMYPEFPAYFNAHTKDYQVAGAAFLYSYNQSLFKGDAAAVKEAFSTAIKCDADLGIPSNDSPH